MASTTTAAVVSNQAAAEAATVGTAKTSDATLVTTTTPTLADDVLNVTLAIATKPAASSLALSTTAGVGKLAFTKPADTANWAYSEPAAGVVRLTSTGTAAVHNGVVGTINITPDVPGIYTITVTPSGATTTNTAKTFTFNAAGTGALYMSTPSAYSATSASSATQIAGGTATFWVNSGTGDTSYNISASGGNLLTANTVTTRISSTNTTAAATYVTTGLVNNNGTNLAAGVTWTPGTAGVDWARLVVTSATAGVVTLTLQPVNSSGVPGTAVTATATFVTTGSNAISAANTTLSIQSAACPTLTGTSASADAVQFATNAISSAYRGQTVRVCVSARDANQVAVSLAATSTLIFSLGGTISANTNFSGNSKTDHSLTTGAVVTGAGTVSVLLIDGNGNAISKTAPLTVYGSLSKLTLSNVNFAAAYAGSATVTGAVLTPTTHLAADAGVPGKPGSALGVLAVVATDAAGNVIDLAAAGQSNSVSSFTVDSGAVAGAPAAGTSDSVGATVGMSTSGAGVDSSPLAFGSNVAVVNCNASTKAEKLTIAVRGLDSSGNRVTSNTVDFYCSDVTSTVAVTTGATSVAAGATTTVDVAVKDANGFPVADGTSVSLIANNGAGISVASKTTSNGKFSATSLPTLLIGSTGPVGITATAGTKTGSAKVEVTGGSANIATQIDALNAKIVALNALIAKIMKKLGVK